ncbi:hypothetical protein, partial [Agaribacter marinus]|uniref:hypothetical protein n=1 Tax=Agaribacter marinus TaxID=1431249 RepID=UPI0024E0D797
EDRCHDGISKVGAVHRQMNNPRISAGQPTNLLASLDALTQFTWDKLFRLTGSGKIVAFYLTWGVIPTLNIRGNYLAAYTWAKPQAASSCPSDRRERT